MLLTGAEIVVQCLQRENVKYVFGYPGGAVLHIYDAFFQQDQIRHVLVRHEQAAVHAADGYARASGEVGVALVTSGPGATNAVTGIATAYGDSIPVVILSGQVPTAMIGQDAFQEVDIYGMTIPITLTVNGTSRTVMLEDARVTVGQTDTGGRSRTVLDADGKPWKIVKLASDLTPRKRMERDGAK